MKGRWPLSPEGWQTHVGTHAPVKPDADQAHRTRNPTTSFLTATTLIYATGAGITAAAGTRLALQWILVKGFKLYSFQLRRLTPPHCYLLSLPRRVGIG